MARHSMIREFIAFLKEEQKWWLIPLVVMLLLLGGILVLVGHSVWGAFIYPFF